MRLALVSNLMPQFNRAEPADPHSSRSWEATATALRGQMPVTGRYAYYDHAAVGPLPAPTAAAMIRYAEQASQQGDAVWMSWFGAVQKLRETAANLIGAAEDEIALVPNTTHGINLVAEGFPWRDGDNLVVPANEFPSNLLPWRNLARRGVTVRLVEVPSHGEISLDAIREQIDHRTRLLAISWVGFSSGYRIDVAKVAELAHAHDCLLLLDAIQGLGAFPLDVQQTGVDFVCADGHKWMLGPEGAGLLYVRQPHLDLLQPLGLGWNSLAAAAFDPASVAIKTSAARYEGGATNMSGMIGLGASLQLLLDQGVRSADRPIAEAILAHVAYLEQELSAQGFHCHLPQQAEHRSGILGVSWPEADASGEATYAEARKHCLAQDIVLSVRGGRLRISPHAYHNLDDHQRLIEALVHFRRATT